MLRPHAQCLKIFIEEWPDGENLRGYLLFVLTPSVLVWRDIEEELQREER